jgi:hypothetical protein
MTAWSLPHGKLSALLPDRGSIAIGYRSGDVEFRNQSDGHVVETVDSGLVLKGLCADGSGDLFGIGTTVEPHSRSGLTEIFEIPESTFTISSVHQVSLQRPAGIACSSDDLWIAGVGNSKQEVLRLAFDNLGEAFLINLPSYAAATAIDADKSDIWVLMSSGNLIRLDESANYGLRDLRTSALSGVNFNPRLVVLNGSVYVMDPDGYKVTRIAL